MISHDDIRRAALDMPGAFENDGQATRALVKRWAADHPTVAADNPD